MNFTTSFKNWFGSSNEPLNEDKAIDSIGFNIYGSNLEGDDYPNINLTPHGSLSSSGAYAIHGKGLIALPNKSMGERATASFRGNTLQSGGGAYGFGENDNWIVTHNFTTYIDLNNLEGDEDNITIEYFGRRFTGWKENKRVYENTPLASKTFDIREVINSQNQLINPNHSKQNTDSKNSSENRFIATKSTTLANSPEILYDIGQNIIYGKVLEGGLVPIRANTRSVTIFEKEGVSSKTVDYVNTLQVHFDLNPATKEVELGELVLAGDFYFETGSRLYPYGAGVSWNRFRKTAISIAKLESVSINYWTGPKGTKLKNGMESSSSNLFSLNNLNTNINLDHLVESFGNKDVSIKLISDLQKYLNGSDTSVILEPSAPTAKNYLRTSKIKASTWSDDIRINLEKTGSTSDSVIQAKQVDKSEYDSGFVGSIVTGTSDDDIVRGLAGFDQLFGKAGDDLIHGGNGRDIIDGGSGSDELHGDFGWNTFLDQQDGSKDLIAIKSDQHLSNFWYGKAGNSPNGEKADFIEGLDATDEIKIIGVFTPEISVVDNVTARGVTGISIYAKGTLEAVYTGGNLSTSQIQNMTTGDGSTAAMNNQMWSYWGDNTVPPLQA